MDDDDGGKYGARDEIQAPSCASFLFRPSSASHWLQACRFVARHPKLQALSAAWDKRWKENTVDNGDSKRPNWNWIDRAPSKQQTAQPHCHASICSLAGWPTTYSLASNTPERAHHNHIECAKPTDHQGGTITKVAPRSCGLCCSTSRLIRVYI